MDYKYIEQLLDRYWECQTTLKEESILHSFFAQGDIPASLLPYRSIFEVKEKFAQKHADRDFEARLMDRLGFESKKHDTRAKLISLPQQLSPLWRAASVVAIILSIGMATQQATQQSQKNTIISHQATELGYDTIQLFTEQPQLSPNTEAALTITLNDSLNITGTQ